jgi:hypothetical protein
MKKICSALVLICLCTPFLFGQKSTIPSNYQLVYSQDFESPQAKGDFTMTDPDAWKINMVNGQKTLELFGKSEYEARVRSPFNIAVLESILLSDFVMEVKLAQSGREYGHRDLCLFFGIQNPSNFYYVHIASVADQNANNIFIVNDEPRTNIATKTTKGTDWGATNSWHTARIERDSKAGHIRIYFDDMDAPIMEAKDLHFIQGSIGLGSFDDTGQFDELKIWAPNTIQKKLGFFSNSNTKIKDEN